MARDFFEWWSELPTCKHCEDDFCKECQREKLAATIRAAVEEAEKQWDRDCLKVKLRAYKDAAKIAESYCSCIDDEHNDDECSVFELSQEIRARAQEMK